MFRIARVAAESTPDADAGIDLETLCAVRINQFNRGGPFPGGPVPARVRVNPGRRVEQIPQVSDE